MSTKFSFEVPIPHLADFAPYQDYTFALSFLLRDKRYEGYIQNRLDLGETVIIDNSYNELQKAEPCSTMIALYDKFHPTMVMCPDDHSFSCEDLEEEYYTMVASVPFKKVMVIYKTMEQWDLLNRKLVPYPNRAVPYDWRDGSLGHKFPDSFMFPESHFLGLVNLKEVLRYKPKTLDTSMPLKIAMKGWTLGKWVEEGCPHIHTSDDEFFFTRTLEPEVIKLAIANILQLKGICNG